MYYATTVWAVGGGWKNAHKLLPTPHTQSTLPDLMASVENMDYVMLHVTPERAQQQHNNKKYKNKKPSPCSEAISETSRCDRETRPQTVKTTNQPT